MFRARFRAAVVIAVVLAAGGQAEFQVNTYTQHHQTDPAVAMNDNGDFVVVWRSHIADGREGGVYGRCFSGDGNARGEEFKISLSDVEVDGWGPAVAITPSGSFAVAWVAASDGDSDLVARLFEADGSASTEELPVAVSPDAAASMPSMAMNSSGAFVIVWTNWYGDAYIGRSYAAGRAYDANGVPVSEEFEISDRPQQCWPDVAMEESGRFVVTWIRMGDTYNRPYGEYIMIRQFEADGTPSSREVPLTDDLNSRWYGPSVAASQTGGFLVTWAVGPFPYDICAQPFDSAAVPITPPYLVNTTMRGNQGHPTIACNGSDDYLIVWDCHNSDGTGSSVRGQFCTRDGEIVGDEMVFGSQGTGRHWYPDAALVADGRYVVVWISENLDGAGYGIFAEVGAQ